MKRQDPSSPFAGADSSSQSADGGSPSSSADAGSLSPFVGAGYCPPGRAIARPYDNDATRSRRYAAIDIGTVTSRLLVADVADDGAMVEVLRDRAITDLGQGVDETGLLAPEAIERVGAAVERFVSEIAECGAGVPVMAVATSASRDAENVDEFAARLARAGVELSVIPGEREAALSFAGASSAFPGERVVVVDSGGGSTEVITGRAGAEPDWARSFDVGCRRVTERFLHSDPPASDELMRAAEWVDSVFTDSIASLRGSGQLDARMVAVAGTATSMVSIRDEMAVYDSSLVHGAEVSLVDVDAILDRLSRMTLDERREVVGLEPGRAPVIVAGTLILQRFMRLAAVDAFTVSERDILHGIIKHLEEQTSTTSVPL